MTEETLEGKVKSEAELYAQDWLNQIKYQNNPRYLVVDFIDKGGWSTVFSGIDRKYDNRKVAIKIANSSDIKAQELYKGEYDFFKANPHPNVVKMYEYEVCGDLRPVLIMELARKSLEDEIKRRTSKSNVGAMQKFSDDEILDIMRIHCEVLSFIHNLGEVHKDIKPENTLIMDDGTYKIGDFGFMTAKAKSGSSYGTPMYRSPEGFKKHVKNEDYTFKSDIYSLAVSLTKILNFTEIFPDIQSDELIELKRDTAFINAELKKMNINDVLREVLATALSPEPKDRNFEDAMDFYNQVETAFKRPYAPYVERSRRNMEGIVRKYSATQYTEPDDIGRIMTEMGNLRQHLETLVSQDRIPVIIGPVEILVQGRRNADTEMIQSEYGRMEPYLRSNANISRTELQKILGQVKNYRQVAEAWDI